MIIAECLGPAITLGLYVLNIFALFTKEIVDQTVRQIDYAIWTFVPITLGLFFCTKFHSQGTLPKKKSESPSYELRASKPQKEDDDEYQIQSIVSYHKEVMVAQQDEDSLDRQVKVSLSNLEENHQEPNISSNIKRASHTLLQVDDELTFKKRRPPSIEQMMEHKVRYLTAPEFDEKQCPPPFPPTKFLRYRIAYVSAQICSPNSESNNSKGEMMNSPQNYQQKSNLELQHTHMATEFHQNKLSDLPDRKSHFSKSKQLQLKKFDETNNINEDNEDFEKRYCIKCDNEQPLRAKHCMFCQRCIPLYDHHCPWIGTCIGEKNKWVYMLYLAAQVIQLILGLIKGMHQLATNEIDGVAIILICSMVLISLITILTVLLLVYQIYYISRNITTCREYLSWSKITYLQTIGRDRNSPFNNGCMQNFREFIDYSISNSPRVWKLM